MRRLSLVLLSLLYSLSSSPALAGNEVGKPASAALRADADGTDRFIVKLRDPAADPRPALAAIGGTFGERLEHVRRMSGGAHVVRLGRRVMNLEAHAVAGRLRSDPRVVLIEPDVVMHPMLVPNDTMYAQQWHYYEAQGGINLPAAWDRTTGAASITVAVIDTGVLPHADLASRLAPGYDFVAGVAGGSDPGDYGCNGSTSSWHGTHVAGTIGAVSNNANGVTGVREMYGAPFAIAAWKQKYYGGEPWPRMIGSGHILDGPKPVWPGSAVAGNAEEARAAVDRLHAAGADFIKVYTKLPRDAYFAALDEAKKVGTYCAGHVPDAVTVAEASDHGQRSIEHLTGVAMDCSSEAEKLHAERAAAAADTTAGKLFKTWSAQTSRIVATQDPKRAAELFATLKRNHTWMVPTFTVLRSMSSMNDSVFAADPRVKYMPAQIADGWDWKKDFRFRARTPEDWANGRKSFKLSMQIVGAMNEAGVPILAGTDMLNPFTFPGFSLHDELGLLNEAGLSPAEALRAATLSPAVFMNATDSLGTVEKGKRADLVLLDDNPLDDIQNVRKVNAVVLNGRLYDRAALDALIADEQKKARP